LLEELEISSCKKGVAASKESVGRKELAVTVSYEEAVGGGLAD
jgi:hypothetical protein